MRILLITLSNIGDVIMTTPVLEALHLAYPEALVDIVADARSAIIFKHCPYKGDLFLKEKKQGWRGTFSLIKQLRKRRYDIAVDLRSDGLLHLIKAKQKFHKLSNKASMHMHSVEKHFATINKLPVHLHQVHTKIWLSNTETEFVEQVMTVKNKRILALGLGANFKGKIWPVTHFIALAKALKDDFDLIVLVGNIQDADISKQFVADCDLPMMDFCGKLDLLTTAALLQKADYFVGNDSGLGHIASAVGTSTFTVFGVGQPHRYKPWGDNGKWYQDTALCIGQIMPSLVAEQIKLQLTELKLVN